MADNVISKIIRLIFDKNSGKKVEDDAKKTLGNVDQSVTKLKDGLASLARTLAAAFAIKKILDFGRASIQAAVDSRREWTALGNVIDNAGGNFRELEGSIRASADAFSAATIHDDDSYARSLQRLIVLTGDITASTNNMGLIANVAAAFYKGELAPATELVAKVMNGQTTALRKLGIETKDADEALRILAERSMNSASKEAATFSGRMLQLNNLWGDFQKAIGNAIISTNGGTDGLTALKAALQTAMEWVVKNEKAIGDWVSKGINFAITATDVLYRGIVGMAQLLQGSFNFALGVVVKGLGFLTQGYSAAIQGASGLVRFVNKDVAADWERQAKEIGNMATALHDWADAAIRAGGVQAKKGFDTLAVPIFTPASVLSGPSQEAELEVNDPMRAIRERNLDVLSKMDEDYWKKRIGMMNTGMAKARQTEEDITKLYAAEFSERQELAATLATELFAALEGGLGPIAANKAKQNLMESAELAIRAGIAALNPVTAWMASPLLAGAAQHAAIAAGWAALSAAAGGGGGGASISAGSGRVSAAGSSASAASNAQSPGMIVNVWVDGIDPNNTKHQGRVAAVNQNIQERWGKNSSVNVRPMSEARSTA